MQDSEVKRLRSKELLKDIQPISNREKATSSVTGMTWFLSQSGTAIMCNQRERKQGGWGDNDGAGMGSWQESKGVGREPLSHQH